ncbi:MAG: transposase [Bacteroidota bacterium]
MQTWYRESLSDYLTWEQKEHAKDYMVFPDNTGPLLSIDETALSKGELYTIVTNKAAKGGKGAIVAMIKGTKAEAITKVLERIPEKTRAKVEEVTMDMAGNMSKAVGACFPRAQTVIDRFHVQKLAYDAVQELRIKYRWEAIDAENTRMALAKMNKQAYEPQLLANGDTEKQLLVRSRFLLFKQEAKWSASQKERAQILFVKYPLLKTAYDLAMKLGRIYSVNKDVALTKLALWYNQVEDSGIEAFGTVSRSVQLHYEAILRYFNNKSTNASAESFNAKIKGFRATSRGVRDIPFFLYRLAKIYA